MNDTGDTCVTPNDTKNNTTDQQNDKFQTSHRGTSGAKHKENKDLTSCDSADSRSSVPSSDDALSLDDVRDAVEQTVNAFRGQLSPWAQAKLMASLCAQVGRGCVPAVAQKTGIPRTTLFYLADIGSSLAEYDSKISGIRLAHQTRCLRRLAKVQSEDAAACAAAIDMIADETTAQNTAEAALAALEVQAVNEADFDASDFKDIKIVPLDDATLELEAFKLVANDPLVSPVHRMIGSYLRLSDQDQYSFLLWLDAYLDAEKAKRDAESGS